MNEMVKTGVFVAVTCVLGLVAAGPPLFSRPSADEGRPGGLDASGRLFPPFDALDAWNLRIVQFDADTGTPRSFQVAQQNNRWVIPSQENYPADADRQLGVAAAAVMDLTSLSVATENKSDQALYGVLHPEEAKPGDKGVGTLVELKDRNGRGLVEVVIGKEVKDREGLRYVRKPKQNVVHIAEVDPSKLSTSFEDWIEKDLLKLNSWDIRDVEIHSYSVDEAAQRIVPGDRLMLHYDDQESKWSLEGLDETEELESTKLNDMKNALDDLKIVDVRRKPAGLSRELRRVEGARLDANAQRSLAIMGFYLTQEGALVSNEGEIVCRLNDGVEYTLRFGQIAIGTAEAKKEEHDDASTAQEKTDDAEEEETTTGENRYIFLMAHYDPDVIPKPELTPVPAEPAAPAAATDASSDDQQQNGGDDADPAAEGQDPGATDEDVDLLKIKAENQRKQREYDDKVATARTRVDELNARFADWYYVISDSVYRRVHLEKSDVVKEKPLGDGNTLDDFNKLKEGISTSDETDS